LAPPQRRRLIRALRGLNSQLLKVAMAPRPDPNRISRLDGEFHALYVHGAAGPRLLALHHGIKPQAERYVRVYVNALMDEIATSGDRIARIAPPGTLREARTRERVDARGLVVAPGFIDIQAHSRDALLIGDGRVVGKVTQGVTTEIMGEGWTNAPVNDHVLQA